MPNKFDKLAEEAQALTDQQFKSKFSSLTSMTDSDIQAILSETGIKKENLAELLSAVKNATTSNNMNAKAIGNISKGVETLVSIAKKLL